ncbi:hypothetical protein F9C07_2278447 [Aspergillus flavus]|uniref:Uncharacterized protein n=5 Tax=Aspergillus subgen. Circumdati TaxID=2720871 RepID=B8N2S7_ASPFN|nr:uncharacterized protein G4B84_004084 [Aspergillus flavus NRRL3357]EIT81609.1 hypothetical protein Ao3042_01834 [Aspergillus oryzae 3.042]KDE83262.1 hypothetical protein AO1008_09755 [Aspergillus oryzae 100-8]OOO09610.1 hypothetical protein OAory_01054180 [Aspergillus oryzae]QMW40870.1 hypothetical protein G4B11_004150 [Aspergillus flavus]GMG51145.1 unnamed protein product [Aspergillus oryzae var. brunneus]|eukprot:EIT81609.1 hypothetical protein Ao3042_01834 [Aspergillus oryzae 3.042]
MKITTTIGLLFTLLTTSTSATPFYYGWSDSVTLQLSNDWSGRHAEASVATDGRPHAIEELFDNSDLEQDGKIFATSAQLTKFHHNTICRVLQNQPRVEVTLDDENTWSFLDRGAWVDVHRGVVICFEK